MMLFYYQIIMKMLFGDICLVQKHNFFTRLIDIEWASNSEEYIQKNGSSYFIVLRVMDNYSPVIADDV